MREQDAAELRGLLPLLLDLLAKVASGEVQPWDADADYRRLHSEVRAILTAYGEPCVCPWPTVWGWHGTAADDPDWQTTLAKRASSARILCGLDEPPPWTFIAGEAEPGEQPEDTAVREVKEETALDVAIERML